MKKYLTKTHYREFSAGSTALCPNTYDIEELVRKDEPLWTWKYRVFKNLVDYGCSIISLPLIALIALVLFVLNPWLNPGPVFFRQTRAGKFGQPFRMWKFRTMLPADAEARDPNAALEVDRITRLGRVLRKSRIDEIPNMINVLRGEMSIVGPRPDAANHVDYYSQNVFGYAKRHRVKPGITGLAQVEQGYVEDEEATVVKAKYDNLYVERSCGRLDVYIIMKTFRVMVGGFGAK